MTTADSLNAALDAEPWFTLTALADLAEEQGKPFLALGYRWLIERKKSPGFSRGRYLWLQSLRGKPLEQLGASSWSVPAEVRDEIKTLWRSGLRQVIGYQPWEFSDASKAYYAAALAIASLAHRKFDVTNKEWW